MTDIHSLFLYLYRKNDLIKISKNSARVENNFFFLYHHGTHERQKASFFSFKIIM